MQVEINPVLKVETSTIDSSEVKTTNNYTYV